MKQVIYCKNLVKAYGKFNAIDGIDLSLDPHKIYGLLGRNGAGKTTLLNMLAAHLFHTSGELKVFGQPVFENQQVLEQICLVKEKNGYKKGFSIKDILEIAAGFYPQWDRAFAQKLVEDFELDVKKEYKKVSKGMESSMGIVIGLASRAPLTIFDEPSLGLDAAARQLFYDVVVQDYMEHPRTIIISTHMIDEVAKLFEEVIILDKGKIKLVEEADTLRQQYCYLSGTKELVSSLLENRQVLHLEQFGNTHIAAVKNDFSPADQQAAIDRGINFELIPLQKLFVYLTSKKEER